MPSFEHTTTGRWRLRDQVSRKFLHESLEALTSDPRFAWRGDGGQLERMLEHNPKWERLEREPLPG